jgi:hypothetical protein
MSRELPPFGLRMPLDLRERLDIAAGGNKASLNAEIVRRLKNSFEESLRPDEFLDALSVNGIFRLRSTSTYRDVERLILLLRRLMPRRVYLGARRDEANDYALVAIVDASPLLIVADKTLLNIARPARESEVQHLIRTLIKKLGWRSLEFFPSHLPETGALTPENAYAVLKSLRTVPLNEDNLPDYLSLLTNHPQLLVLADYLADREVGETGDW